MKKAVAGSYVIDLVIIFLLIMFGFMLAAYSYSKAYRVSKSVTSLIENHSGYSGTTSVTQQDIDSYLSGIGYSKVPVTTSSCPVKKGKNATWAMSGICIYKLDTIKDKNNEDLYIRYGVVSYMTIDLPLIDLVRVPIYGETEKIYIFN